MKKSKKNISIIVIVLLFSNLLTAQNVTIPDANFKAALVGNFAINLNFDGEIQVSEAAIYAATLNVSSLSITNLTGIEAFTSISALDCSSNSLTSLNISSNTLLTILDCSNNLITNLTVSSNPALTFLACNNNQLSSLNISSNSALNSLNCSTNQLTSLSISSNTSLTDLNCNTNLLTSLNVSSNSAITNLNCGGNQLTIIDVSFNPSLVSLFCSNNQLTSLDVVTNTALTELNCFNNQLSSLNIKNGNNVNLTIFNAVNNPSLSCVQVDDVTFMNTSFAAAIDVTTNYFIDCNTCVVNIPDANFKAALLANLAINLNSDGEIQCNEATGYTGSIIVNALSISSLTGIEAFASITTLNCYNNNLNDLNVSSNVLLTSLNCGMNNISILNLSNNTSLTYLNADYNNLSNIDLSLNTALTYINIGGNSITSIDLSNNTSAVTLYLGNNLFSNLDLSNNLSVTFLDCGYNSQLTNLNITANSAITSLLCSNSNLSILNIQNGNNLNFSTFNAINNPNLKCILVDDPIFMNTNWASSKDAGANYNTDCTASWCNTTFICSVTVNSLQVSDGEIYLFKQNNLNSRMDTIAVATISSSTYTFDEMLSGNYIVYYKPNLTTHPNTPGTYNGNVTDWNTGILSTTTCNTSYTININATTFTTFTGPGTISGKIKEGAKYGKTDALGDPIPGVDISLEQNPGGIMVAQTVTDINGDFTFTNLPENNYRVKVNIPGTPHTSYHDVSITASNTVISNLEYIVDSTEIYPLSDNVNISNTDAKNSFQVIPNPFDNEAQIILPNEWKNSNQELLITITDISGKLVYCMKNNSNSKVIISRENLENGMYFIKIENSRESVTQKIILTN